jgi:hypothetical protein
LVKSLKNLSSIFQSFATFERNYINVNITVDAQGKTFLEIEVRNPLRPERFPISLSLNNSSLFEFDLILMDRQESGSINLPNIFPSDERSSGAFLFRMDIHLPTKHVEFPATSQQEEPRFCLPPLIQISKIPTLEKLLKNFFQSLPKSTQHRPTKEKAPSTSRNRH